MLSTIAYVAIFSAILVFFADEWRTYFKAIAAKPYKFLSFSLFLASTLLILFFHWFFFLVVTTWLGLMMVVQWLNQHIGLPVVGIWLAKWLVFVLLACSPLVIVWLRARIKKLNYKKRNVLLRQGYMVSIIIAIVVLLLFGVEWADFLWINESK